MTRLEAIRQIRNNWGLETSHLGLEQIPYGFPHKFKVKLNINWEKVVVANFSSCGSYYVSITPKQLLNFIKNNFPKHQVN